MNWLSNAKLAMLKTYIQIRLNILSRLYLYSEIYMGVYVCTTTINKKDMNLSERIRYMGGIRRKNEGGRGIIIL